MRVIDGVAYLNFGDLFLAVRKAQAIVDRCAAVVPSRAGSPVLDH